MSSDLGSSPTISKITIHPVSHNTSAPHYLIFFITGNPGLISYYDTFLKTLHELLSNSSSSSSNIFHIHGQSLAGFEDDDTRSQSTSHPRQYPYSLQDQIDISLESLKKLSIPSGPLKSKPYTSIILIGHSVGSYMLLEIIQRLRNSSSSLKISAGILLFPTVTHIAQSPSGRKFSALIRIPDFPRSASSMAKGLIWLTPKSVLKWLVELVANMPEEAAEVTTKFLTSRMGIWQALHMAKDEMEQITEDSWDEDIWGVEHEDPNHKFRVPKLFFYFGQNDHWVADHTRDQLIAVRGREEGDNQSSKPIMMIDETGVDHGFCIHHSESMAEKAKVWIDAIMTDS